jgi:hypothetical protein
MSLPINIGDFKEFKDKKVPLWTIIAFLTAVSYLFYQSNVNQEKHSELFLMQNRMTRKHLLDSFDNVIGKLEIRYEKQFDAANERIKSLEMQLNQRLKGDEQFAARFDHFQKQCDSLSYAFSIVERQYFYGFKDDEELKIDSKRRAYQSILERAKVEAKQLGIYKDYENFFRVHELRLR